MRNVNLLEGDIKKTLIKMSIPLMGVSFVQITYNLIAMFWLGRFSDDAVAAVGTASLVTYIGNSIALIGRVGTATWVSQSFGNRDYVKAIKYVESGVKLNIIISLLYTVFAYFMINPFLSLFTLTDTVRNFAIEYLYIQIIGMVILFVNPMFAVSYNSIGNSITPFKVSLIGLITNFILNPILIFGLKLGIKGASLATVLAQCVVLTTYLIIRKDSDLIMSQLNFFSKMDKEKIINILKIGWPASVQSTVMGTISIIMSTFISRFGSMPLAVYSLGIQIESICWMTADGFAVAVASFMGQNLGAGQYDRIKNGYTESIKIFMTIGGIAMVILLLFGEQLISLFMPNDPAAITEGGRLLRIMGVSEILMAIEIGVSGALNGIGLTKFPAANGLVGNVLRIPISLLLMPALGVVGIWVAISATMALKGIVGIFAYEIIRRRTNGFRELAYRRT